MLTGQDKALLIEVEDELKDMDILMNGTIRI